MCESFQLARRQEGKSTKTDIGRKSYASGTRFKLVTSKFFWLTTAPSESPTNEVYVPRAVHWT